MLGFLPRDNETKISLLKEPRNIIEIINSRARLGLVAAMGLMLSNSFTPQIG